MTLARPVVVPFGAAALVLAASCARPIPVGAIVSETGATSFYGAKVRKGLDLALEELRASGGIGRRIQLVYRDDASNPEVGLRAARDLIENQGVGVIVGGVSSAVTLRIAPLCERTRTVLLSPTCSAPSITGAGEYVFRNFPSDDLEGSSMADFANDLGLRRVAVLAVDGEYGAGLARVFRARFLAGVGRTSATFTFAEGEPAAFDAAVRDAASFEPDGLYLVAYAADAAEILRRVRARGMAPVLLGTSAMTEQALRAAGPAAESLVYPEGSFDPASDEEPVRRFVAAFRSRYGEEPDAFAAHGYDALRLVAVAMDRGGSPAAEAVRKGLLSITDYNGATGRTAFDANGDVVQYPRLSIVRSGRALPYDRFVNEGGALGPPRRGEAREP